MKPPGQWLSRFFPVAEVPESSLQQRLVIVDTETTGLNPKRDELLSIGAVAIQQGKLNLEDCFYKELKADNTPSARNVLVHRLTPSKLKLAEQPQQVLQDFIDYVDDAPLFAYHAKFDETVLNHALVKNGMARINTEFIDVAHMLLVADPEVGGQPLSLEAANAYLRIQNSQRHNAHGDALNTALLMLKLLKMEKLRTLDNTRQLYDMIKHNQHLRRWRQ